MQPCISGSLLHHGCRDACQVASGWTGQPESSCWTPLLLSFCCTAATAACGPLPPHCNCCPRSAALLLPSQLQHIAVPLQLERLQQQAGQQRQLPCFRYCCPHSSSTLLLSSSKADLGRPVSRLMLRTWHVEPRHTCRGQTQQQEQRPWVVWWWAAQGSVIGRDKQHFIVRPVPAAAAAPALSYWSLRDLRRQRASAAPSNA